jgi:hypothetical protein
VEPSTAAVESGRDPVWRVAWEGLDETSRRAVRDAVKTGATVQNPTLTPFVFGLIARKRRALRSSVALWAVVTSGSVFWVYATTVLRPSAFAAFWVAMLLVCLTLVPIRLRSARRTLAKCESAQADEERDEPGE